MANIQQRLERELKRREEIHNILKELDKPKKTYLREQYLVNRRIANLSYLLRKEQWIIW